MQKPINEFQKNIRFGEQEKALLIIYFAGLFAYISWSAPERMDNPPLTDIFISKAISLSIVGALAYNGKKLIKSIMGKRA